MAARSKVWPSIVFTGSSIRSDVMPQKKPRGASVPLMPMRYTFLPHADAVLHVAAHADVVHHAAALPDVVQLVLLLCRWMDGYAAGWVVVHEACAKGGLVDADVECFFWGVCVFLSVLLEKAQTSAAARVLSLVCGVLACVLACVCKRSAGGRKAKTKRRQHKTVTFLWNLFDLASNAN